MCRPSGRATSGPGSVVALPGTTYPGTLYVSITRASAFAVGAAQGARGDEHREGDSGDLSAG